MPAGLAVHSVLVPPLQQLADRRARVGGSKPVGLDDELGQHPLGLALGATHGLTALTDAGFELLPTFGRPHFTVVLPGDDRPVVDRLLNALGPAESNSYHVRPRR